MDAVFKAIDKISGLACKLLDYGIHSVSVGKDAIGEVHLKIQTNSIVATGRGASTDVIEASAKAYLNAVNRILAKQIARRGHTV